MSRCSPGLGLLALVLLLVQASLWANPVASLDRDRISIGETITLNVEHLGAVSGDPDISALERDFIVLGQARSEDSLLGPGGLSQRHLWAATLQPRAEGVLGIPALDWGEGRTEPLSVTVLPAIAGGRAGDPVFIEVEIEDQTPYVHQAVVYTVRLNYSVPLVEGRLDGPDVSGAELRQIGEDRTFQRNLGGQRYNVVERRYLLVPERSGELKLGSPQFQGRTLSGGRGLQGGIRTVSEQGAPMAVQVAPRPAAGAVPWIPARALELELDAPPATGRIGEPLTLTLRVRALGLTRGQLPDFELPTGEGYQVHAEAADLRERVEDGQLVVEGVRRFIVLPVSGDRLTIPGWGVDWWQLEEDRPARAEIPGVELELSPGQAAAGWELPVPGPTPAVAAAPPPWPWIALSVLLASAWLLTLAWALQRRATPARQARPGVAAAGAPLPTPGPAPGLARALSEGDLDAVADALIQASPQPHEGLSGVQAWLAGERQVEAVAALQSARWGHGDPAQARMQLREAFSGGPRWKPATAGEAGHRQAVPPLYP